jgi:hypothetical protein
VSEKQLQNAVIEAAQILGWRVAHFRTSMNLKGGYSTAVAADGKGFPDLVLVRGERLMFIELKSRSGKTSDHQNVWLSDLNKTAAEVFVFRPNDWESGVIERRLK